jgi:hypothetical protein
LAASSSRLHSNASPQNRSSWSRPLPQTLVIPDVMTLTTLADVRVFVTQRLPRPYRNRPHWLVVARDLEAAARGGDAADASMAIRMALLIEGVACRPERRTP